MLKRISICFVVLCAQFWVPVSASSYTGTIVGIMSGPNYGNKVFLQMDAAPSSRPACSTNATNHFVFDGTTPTGQIVLASAMTAYTAGKNVRVQGFDACTLFSNVEDLRDIRNQ